MLNKEKIKINFSKASQYYDKYAKLQNLCAEQLIKKIKINHPNLRILEIGCGTGNYTKLLKDKFPHSKITALDISYKMIEIAKKKLSLYKDIEFIVADGEKINLKQRFDLITSNACLQWFEDLPKTFMKYKDLLTNNGIILFSMFGPMTLSELNEVLHKVLKDDILIASQQFIEKTKLEKILKGLFTKVKVERRIYKEKYNSLMELLRNIKYTGTGTNTCRRALWTRKLILQIEKIYKIFTNECIIATYEVFFCFSSY